MDDSDPMDDHDPERPANLPVDCQIMQVHARETVDPEAIPMCLSQNRRFRL